MDRVARRGPLVNIFVAVEGGPFGEKKFRKKISQCRKSKISKKLKGPFGEKKISEKKSRSAEKNGPLHGFSRLQSLIHIVFICS